MTMNGISKSKWATVLVVLGGVVGCANQPAAAPVTMIRPPSLGGNSSSTSTRSAAPGVERASSAKVQQGIDAIQSKDFAKAKAVLTQARAAQPKDPQAAFYLGVADEGLGDKKAAAEQYKQALALDRNLTEAAVNLSALLLDQNDPQGALAVARQGLSVAPKEPGLLMNQALALEATGDKAGAAKAYGEAVAAAPGNADLRYAHAELLAETGQRNAALAELTKITTDNPKLALAMAILYGKLGEFDRCVTTLGPLLQRHPSPEAYVSRGRCRHAQKNTAGEQADYEAAVKLDPSFAPAHYFLGELYRDSGKKKQALGEFKKAAKLAGGSQVGKAAKKAAAELRHGRRGHRR